MTGDSWDSAVAYERFMGRLSRPFAGRLVGWLGLPPGGHWLDVGCGTGALAAAIMGLARPATLTAVDTSASFVAYCESRVHGPGVVVVQAGLDTLPARAGGFDVVASSLVLNFLPDPVAGLARMSGLCAPGGTVAACVWDYGEGMGPLRAFWTAARAVDPGAAVHDEGARFPSCRPEPLRTAFREAGLRDVDVAAVTIPAVYAGFEDYWSSFLGGTGPAPSYLASLPESSRHALESRLRELLPVEGGGEVVFEARAWAVRGRGGRAA